VLDSVYHKDISDSLDLDRKSHNSVDFKFFFKN
jgi:hypothetical protein